MEVEEGEERRLQRCRSTVRTLLLDLSVSSDKPTLKTSSPPFPTLQRRRFFSLPTRSPRRWPRERTRRVPPSLRYPALHRPLLRPHLRKFAPDSRLFPLPRTLTVRSRTWEFPRLVVRLRTYPSAVVRLVGSSHFLRLPLIPFVLRSSRLKLDVPSRRCNGREMATSVRLPLPSFRRHDLGHSSRLWRLRQSL
jgi:hypothetical protein